MQFSAGRLTIEYSGISSGAVNEPKQYFFFLVFPGFGTIETNKVEIQIKTSPITIG